MLGSRVTPRSPPWPPTAHTGCSWPSGQSEASGNGPKWFPIPKNQGLDTKIMSLACSEAELLHGELDHLLRIFDVDFNHPGDVVILLHHVFCPGSTGDQLETPKNWHFLRVGNPPPMCTTVQQVTPSSDTWCSLIVLSKICKNGIYSLKFKKHIFSPLRT